MESKTIGDVLANRPKDLPRTTMTDEELTDLNIARYNNRSVKSNVLDCPKCKNKGYIALKDTYKQMTLKPCECLPQRERLTKMSDLGLLECLKKIPSIKDIPETTNLGKLIKIRLEEYLQEEEPLWLTILGQVGCGKTTYASLVLSRLIEKEPNLTIEVINWDTQWEDMTYKSNNAEDLLYYYKTCDVLYIDDFLRHQELKITDLERRVAKEIIDYRYRFNKRTIITSERTYDELQQMDEAIATRLYEKSTTNNNKYIITIKKNQNYNFRKQKAEEI